MGVRGVRLELLVHYMVIDVWMDGRHGPMMGATWATTGGYVGT